RMARRGLLDVSRDEPGHPGAGGSQRVHEQPQLRGPPGQGRQDPSGEPAGRGGHGDRRALHATGGSLIMGSVTRIERTALPVDLAQESVRALMDAVFDDATTRIVVDLDARTVSAPGVDETFAIDDFTRWRLIEGLDEIGLTLQHDEAIARYEGTRDEWLPTA